MDSNAHSLAWGSTNADSHESDSVIQCIESHIREVICGECPSRPLLDFRIEPHSAYYLGFEFVKTTIVLTQ